MAEVNKIGLQDEEFKQYDSCTGERKVGSRPNTSLSRTAWEGKG
jgi:hypothetical protein